MKILIVTPFFRAPDEKDSGLGNHFHHLAYTLAELGHAITVLVISHLPPSDHEIKRSKGSLRIVRISVQAPGFLRIFGKRTWVLSQVYAAFVRPVYCIFHYLSLPASQKPDIIETTSYGALCLPLLLPGFPPVVMRVSTSHKQIVTNYDTVHSRLLKLVPMPENLCIRWSKYLLTHSASHRDELCKIYGLDPLRFSLIPHGLELPSEAAVKAAAIQQEPSKVSILYVGRFEYRKGTDVLLDAIPQLLETNSKIHFTLVGRDDEDSFNKRFRGMTSDRFSDRVRYEGVVDDITLQRLYSQCDIFVAPSRYESFGLIYVEAMGWGKPVVGCRCGGIPDVIKEGYSGMMAKPGDPEDLARILLILSSNTNRRRQLGENARKEAVSLFSREAMAESAVKLYRSILPDGGPTE
jgi:glycosyltransferase involved in cell wall biosynthesis